MVPTENNPEVNDIVAAQAKRWLLLRQSGEMSEAQLRQFERWCQQDSAHLHEYTRLTRLWSELDLIADDVLVDEQTGIASFAGGVTKAATVTVQPLRPAVWVAACLLLLVTVIGVYQQFTVSSNMMETQYYRTAKGELRTIRLSDGSMLELGADTSARVDFNDLQRVVFLLRGDAYFKVTKDSKRAFIVKTATGQVRAVGTEFEVRLGVEQVRVTVHEGIVEVAAKSSSQTLLSKSRLGAGEQVAYSDKGKLTAVREVDLSLSAVWRSGTMVFEEQPLLEVVEELNRYSDTKIVIGDKRLGPIKVNGVFKNGEVDAVLRAIQGSLPAEIEHSVQQITLRYAATAQG